jgi:hypothetical protein
LGLCVAFEYQQSDRDMGEHVTIRCCIQMFGQPVQRLGLDQTSRQSKKGEDRSECFRFAVAFLRAIVSDVVCVIYIYILFIYILSIYK